MSPEQLCWSLLCGTIGGVIAVLVFKVLENRGGREEKLQLIVTNLTRSLKKMMRDQTRDLKNMKRDFVKVGTLFHIFNDKT